MQIHNSEEIAGMIRDILSEQQQFDRDKEFFFAIGITRANRVKYIDMISMGSLHGTVAEPREVFRMAVHKAASTLVLAHTHPSGNTEPSSMDRNVTRELVAAGKILRIKVIDHVIVCENGYYSFADEGFL